MSEFKVGFNHPNSIPAEYGDDAEFDIIEDGVLKITAPKAGKQFLISPSSWSWIEEPNPKAGTPSRVD